MSRPTLVRSWTVRVKLSSYGLSGWAGRGSCRRALDCELGLLGATLRQGYSARALRVLAIAARPMSSLPHHSYVMKEMSPELRSVQELLSASFCLEFLNQVHLLTEGTMRTMRMPLERQSCMSLQRLKCWCTVSECPLKHGVTSTQSGRFRA